MAYSIKTQDAENGNSWIRSILPHLMYNSGRVLTYTFLGFWLGILGNSFKFFVIDFQSILFILAGIFMSFMGLDLLGLFNISSPVKIPGFVKYKQFVHSLLNKKKPNSIFIYGLTLGFIPCGLVYIAGAEAVASGSGLNGLAIMLSFGLGTIPALFLLGVSTRLITAHFRNRVFKIAAIFVILFGVFTVTKGVYRLMELPLPWMNHSMHSMDHN